MRTSWTTLALAGALFAGAPAIAQIAAAPASPPHDGMRADGNGDGIVTRAEATAQADRQFDRMDLNTDGKVTPEERRTLRDQAVQHRAVRSGDAADAAPPPPPAGDRTGRRMDPDGDGVITREDHRTRALQRFDRRDANHDGRIDAAEMAAIRQPMMDRRGDFGPAPAAVPTPKP